MALLEARGLIKIFGKLTAPERCRSHGRGERIPRLDRAQRLGQEHADEMRRRCGDPDIGHGDIWRPRYFASLSRRRARAGMSLKFQITSVLPALTLYDNILLALQAQTSLPRLVFSRTRGSCNDRAMAMLEQFRLVDRAADPASALSHGQQQWLEIAMALALEPKLLLLDEPTGGMSLEERQVTGELLQPIAKRCSLSSSSTISISFATSATG